MNENVIREVLYFFHAEGGWAPGSFAESLISTFARADAMNFARLREAYPDYAEAVALAMNVGIDALSSHLSD